MVHIELQKNYTAEMAWLQYTDGIKKGRLVPPAMMLLQMVLLYIVKFKTALL